MKLFSLTLLAAIVVVASSEDEPFHSSLSETEFMRSLEVGHSYADRLAQLESQLIANEIYVKRSSPSFRMAQFKQPSADAMQVARQARRLLEATKSLKRSGVTDRDLISLRIGNAGSENQSCLVAPTCSLTKYRTIDGSCNSLQNPLLGRSVTTYRRVLPPNYSDGIEDPRLAVDGSKLKSARYISTKVIGARDRPLGNTLAVMQFGQFINHDMESTTTYNLGDGSGITCCDPEGQFLPEGSTHPECNPIEVPADDPFYTKIGVARTCMNFVNSISGVRIDCSLGPADQVNQNTHWLDASTVYGSNSATGNTLRSFKSGLLVMSTDSSGRKLLPLSSASCSGSACFMAGDSRVTEQPQLALMHTLWAREHNRVATRLAALNPTWNDETVFQEARRIVVAELQHITYAEFLPTILSPDFLTRFRLLPSSGYFTNYQPGEKTGPVSNEFAAAAFRMGHSMVKGFIKLFDQKGMPLSSSYNLSSYFNDASLLVQSNYLDSAIRGLLIQDSNAADPEVSPELTEFLFKGTLPYGFDLVALNIQRGRSHGIPSYNNYRRVCGLPPVMSFNEYPYPLSDLLAQSYNSVDDIDLFVGGLIEFPVPGGKLGPTFSCLIGENFSRLKFTDRFYYELGGQRHSFTPAQLNEIRKARMSRIFCDNSDGTLVNIQPWAFLPASPTNAPVPCTGPAMPSLDLSFWRNEPLF